MVKKTPQKTAESYLEGDTTSAVPAKSIVFVIILMFWVKTFFPKIE